MNSLQAFNRAAAREPFRAFFPLGILLGMAGIALWPLYQWGIAETYPLLAHSRLMSQGFVGSFVLGFLLTAGPRLLGCPRPSGGTVATLLSLMTVSAIASMAGLFALADALFLLAIVALLAGGAYGFARRADLPPPGFVLALAGLGCAAVGGALLLSLSLGVEFSGQYALANTLLFQGFPLLPLIGVGAFFFPKLSGGANTHDFPESRTPSATWGRRAGFAAAAAGAFFVSVAIEVAGFAGTAYGLRAALVFAYLWFETPVFRPTTQPGPQRRHLQVCSLAIVGSFVAIAFFPAMKTAWLHGFFICGLTGSILLVATRVVLGHSGRAGAAARSGGPLGWALLLLVVSSAARIGAMYAPDFLWQLYLVSAALWLLLAAAWSAALLPSTAPSLQSAAC